MINHHPSEATLAAYAAGTLPEALALVAATHLGQCGACRGSLRTLEATGGALLADLAPVPLSVDALDRLLTRLDDPPPPPAPVLNLGSAGAIEPRSIPPMVAGGTRHPVSPVPDLRPGLGRFAGCAARPVAASARAFGAGTDLYPFGRLRRWRRNISRR